MQSHQDVTIEPCLMAQRQTDGGFPWEAGLLQVWLVEPHLLWSEGPVQAAVPSWSLILVPLLVLEMEMFAGIWKMPLWTDWLVDDLITSQFTSLTSLMILSPAFSHL